MRERLDKEKKGQLEDQFRIIVTPSGFIPKDPSPIRFSNWIDFRDQHHTIPLPENRPVRRERSPDKQGKLFDSSKFIIEPIAPICSSPRQERADAIQFAANTFGEISVGSALAMSLFIREKKTNHRRAFIKGLIALAAVVLAPSGACNYAMPQAEHGFDGLAAEYSSRAQVSSFRAILIMFDAWQRNLPIIGDQPVHAVSASSVDALEPISRMKPTDVRNALLQGAHDGLQETLVSSARSVGSVANLFSYAEYDPKKGTKRVELADREFIDALSSQIDPLLGNADWERA